MCGHGHPGADQHSPPVLQQGNLSALWLYGDLIEMMMSLQMKNMQERKESYEDDH